MNKLNIKDLVQIAIVAALYVALTWALAPISYGSIQFRISEILMLLVLFKPSYAIGLILGCFISNTTSSLGWYDMVFGTLATIIALIPMLKIKNIYVSAIFPVVSNAIIVAIELYFALGIEPIWLSMLTVGLGEAVVIYLLGIPFIMYLNKNDNLLANLELKKLGIKEYIYLTKESILAIFLTVLGVVLYIAYPMYFEEGNSASAMALLKTDWWTVIIGIIPLVFLFLFIFLKKNLLKLIILILVALLLLAPYILVGANYNSSLSNVYYYFYPVYIILLILISVYDYREIKDEIKKWYWWIFKNNR